MGHLARIYKTQFRLVGGHGWSALSPYVIYYEEDINKLVEG